MFEIVGSIFGVWTLGMSFVVGVWIVFKLGNGIVFSIDDVGIGVIFDAMVSGVGISQVFIGLFKFSSW